jgi:lipoprotein-releasing system ATP-binding protein
MPEPRCVLSARGIFKSFPSADLTLEVLKGVDLDLEAGQVVAVMGASGTGKSTLLHILGALDRPDAGSVVLEGQDLGRLSSEPLAEVRNRQVGFIFQFHHLLPDFTARENVALPALISGLTREEAFERSDALLAAVGLRERAHHRPGRLSGGEQQRVAVARALVNRPRVVLADEPSGNLDRASSERLHEVLWEMGPAEGQALLVVTHDPDLAARAGHILELRDGRLHPR